MSNCKNDNIFKKLSSNPDVSELLGSSKEHVIVAGNDIKVERSENDTTITHTISYDPVIELKILSFTSSITDLQLKGSTVSTFTLNWSYNEAVTTQSLDNGITAPTPTLSLSYSVTPTGLSITTDSIITLTGDNEDSDPVSKTVSIDFGNYIYQTKIVASDRSEINQSVIEALDLNTLTKTLKDNRNITFTALSDQTEYEVILVPTSFGLNSGSKFKDVSTGFTGGWGKTLTLSLTNSAGFSENYDVWVASNKNLQNITFQII